MANDGGGAPTDRPTEGAKFEWLGLYLGVHFHPPIKLASRDAHEFAAAINEFYEIDHVNLESDGWSFLSSRHDFRIAVTQSQLELHSDIPGQKQERYEVHYRRVLRCFEERFDPQIILASKAMIRGLLPIDGDARAFLAEHVFKISQARLDPLKRPIHLLGMRIFFPAYQTVEDGEAHEGSDWDVDVRLESWVNDPRKLFMEADANWKAPTEWNDEFLEHVVGRLSTVSEYVQKTILGFLQYENDNNPEG